MSILATILGNTIISFALWIISGLYYIASYAFEVFLILATGKLVDSDAYSLIITNFYIIFGIVLLFFLSFSLLRGMVNPDDQKQGTSTVKKVVINLVTSALIMALLPTIFGFLYDFQTSFISKYNVIGRFFGYGNIDDTSGDFKTNTNRLMVERGAYQIVNGVFTAFFNVNTDVCENSGIQVIDNETLEKCQETVTDSHGFWFKINGDLSFANAIKEVNETGKFNIYNDFSQNVEEGTIEFQFLLSLIGGIALIYVAVSFCFDMALRMVKLVFYQIIAPIPIFARVIPEGKLSGSFNQWMKVTLACYFEVYVRIFVFYFVVYLSITMLNGDFLRVELFRYNPIIGLIGKAFVLMGLVMFMRQAPKLISEVTGINSGNMKLGIKDKLKDGGFFTAGAAIGAGVTAGTRNFISGVKSGKNIWQTAKSAIAGAASGAVRGGSAGWKAGSFKDMASAAGKGAKAAVDARDKRAAYKANHPGGVMVGHLNDVVDTVGRWAGLNNIQELTEANQMIDNVTGKVDKVVDNAKSVIKAQADKGKNFGFGVTGSNAAGIAYSLDAYRKVTDLRDRARDSGQAQSLSGVVSNKTIADHAIKMYEDAHGVGSFNYAAYGITAQDVQQNSAAYQAAIGSIIANNANAHMFNADEIQRIFGKYESDYAKEVANSAFLSDVNYDRYKSSVSLEEQAAMTSIRSAAVDAKYELKRVVGSSLISEANANGASGATTITIQSIDGDLKVNDSGALDKLGATAKVVRARNIDEMAKIQQKEKDKNGK